LSTWDVVGSPFREWIEVEVKREREREREQLEEMNEAE
jgi:hypothetical protein